MRRYPAALTLLAILLLAGCKTCPPAPFVAPTVVRVPVTEYVSVPEELTEPCPVPALTGRTVGDVVQASNARKVALDRCNAQLRAIRSLTSPNQDEVK